MLYDNNNLFTWRDPATSSCLFLIDNTGAMSGEALHQLKFRLPEIASAASTTAKSANVGDTFAIRWCTFIVGRRHYRSKWDIEAITTAAAKLDEDTSKSYFLYAADYMLPDSIFPATFTNCATVEWGNWH